jgi:hypothetical protein
LHNRVGILNKVTQSEATVHCAHPVSEQTGVEEKRVQSDGAPQIMQSVEVELHLEKRGSVQSELNVHADDSQA